MDELGVIPYPEQYAEAGGELFLDNSLEAKEYFRAFHETEGFDGVICAMAVLSNLVVPAVPVWIYLVLDEEERPKFIDYAPIFLLEDHDIIQKETILEIRPIKRECYFFWQDILYAAVFTSNDYLAIRRVRALLSENDVIGTVSLERGEPPASVLPVELYSLEEHRFVCACWEINFNDDEPISLLPVCFDDKRLPKDADANSLDTHLIEPGESVDIDGSLYLLRQNRKQSYYFIRQEEAFKDACARNGEKTAGGGATCRFIPFHPKH